MQPIVALTIAGSDAGGGAGIQADLLTFSAFEVHGTSALTAVTAQNTREVREVAVIEPSLVIAQIDAVLADFDVVAVKTGMLAQPVTVEAVADLARAGRLANLVVDPVLVSTSGHALMDDGGVKAYREALLPYARVATPNLREAAALADVNVNDVRSIDDMIALGRAVRGFGPRYVLVKGGHATDGATASRAPDVLVGDEVTLLDAPRLATRNDHGTGCSLSAAIAAGLGYGRDVPDATRDAKSFVLSALRGAMEWRLGQGHGPIDHLGWNA